MFKTMTTKKKKRGLLFLILSALLGIGGISAFASGVNASPIEETRAADTTTTVVTQSNFSAVSGTSLNNNDNISYSSYKGNGTVNPAISSSRIRLYRNKSYSSTNNVSGGYIVLTAKDGNIINSVTITISSNASTNISHYLGDYYTVSTSSGIDLDKCASTTATAISSSNPYTVSGLSASAISFGNFNASNNLDISSISVTYTHENVLPTSIAINEKPASSSSYLYLANGETKQLTYVMKSASSETGEDVSNKNVTWSVESEPEGAFTVSETGLVTANADEGLATVTVTSEADNTVSDSVDFEIIKKTLSSISMDVTNFAKTYQEGDSWDDSGIVVTATYTTGGAESTITEQITDHSLLKWEYDPETPSIGDTQVKITATITEGTNTFTDSQTVTGIEVTEVKEVENTLDGSVRSASTYASWTDVTSTKYEKTGIVYAGYSGKPNDDSTVLQLRSKASDDGSYAGIVTTSSPNGYVLSRIDVVWNSSTTSGRTINVYGKNSSSYGSPNDMWDSTKAGTKIGDGIKYDGSTADGTLDCGSVYRYIGIRSSSSALYLDSVTFVWTAAETVTYANSIYSTVSTICDINGVNTSMDNLKSAWSELSTASASWGTSELKVLKESSSSENNDIGKALAAYDYVVGKYGPNGQNVEGITDFLGRNPSVPTSGLHFNHIFGNDDASTYITILAVAGGVVLASGLFFAFKRKASREEE